MLSPRTQGIKASQRNGNPLQYSCLENPMDGGAWYRLLSMGSQSWARLSDFTSLHFLSAKVLTVPKLLYSVASVDAGHTHGV